MYAPEWVTLVSECPAEEEEQTDPNNDPVTLTTMATQLLILISKHIQTLASDWFSGTVCYVYTAMFLSPYFDIVPSPLDEIRTKYLQPFVAYIGYS